jgi:oligoendopeptidase F
MYDKGAILFGTARKAREGAYTSWLSHYEEAYVYIGRGYDNIATVVHEMGHYASAYTYDFSALNYDLAETHSQGNEWLLTAYMKNHFSSTLYKGLYIYNAYNALISSVMSVLIDAFEYEIYTAETPYTADQLDQVMADLYVEYGIWDRNVTLENVQKYWKQVVLHSPVYYISYATSQIASINIFIVAENDGYDVAVEAYRKLQEDGELEWGFVGNLSAAGLTSPFDEETHIALKEFFLPSKE